QRPSRPRAAPLDERRGLAIGSRRFGDLEETARALQERSVSRRSVLPQRRRERGDAARRRVARQPRRRADEVAERVAEAGERGGTVSLGKVSVQEVLDLVGRDGPAE